jgi:formylglycine-generating enzyme required for sulfatase activity
VALGLLAGCLASLLAGQPLARGGSKEAVSVVPLGEGSQNFRPQWSPDGKKIAFFTNGKGDTILVQVMAAGGRRIQRLSEIPAHKQRDKYGTFCNIWRQPDLIWGHRSAKVYTVSQLGRTLSIGLAKVSGGALRVLAEIECPEDTVPERAVLAPDGRGVVVPFRFVNRKKGTPFHSERPYEEGQNLLFVTDRGRSFWTAEPFKQVLASLPKKKWLAAVKPTGLWLLDPKGKAIREVRRFRVLTYVSRLKFLDEGKRIFLAIRPNWRKWDHRFALVDGESGAIQDLGKAAGGPDHCLPLGPEGRRFLLVETEFTGVRLTGRNLMVPASSKLFILTREGERVYQEPVSWPGDGLPFPLWNPTASPDGLWCALAGRPGSFGKREIGDRYYMAIRNRLWLMPTGRPNRLEPAAVEGEGMERFYLRSVCWHPKKDAFLIVTTRKGFPFAPKYSFADGLQNVDFLFRGEIRLVRPGRKAPPPTRPTPPSPKPKKTPEEPPAAMEEAPHEGKTLWENFIGMKFRWIPSGAFLMGTSKAVQERLADQWKIPPDALMREGPVHRVEIPRGFYIGVFEVTNAEYEKANPDGARDPYADGDRDPVSVIAWPDAVAYCRWLTENDKAGAVYRLPTEAEWEYAARGGKEGFLFPWGDEPDGSKACFDGKRSSPVGRFPPNGFGLHDMSGNVWEWCSDWYKKDAYAKTPRKNPPGPPTGTDHVLRGGAWCTDAFHCRCAARGKYGKKHRGRFDSYGFRVVCTFPARKKR